MRITIRPLEWVIWPIWAWRRDPYVINLGLVRITW